MKLSNMFAALLSGSLSFGAVDSSAQPNQNRTIPEHFYDRYGSDRNIESPKPEKKRSRLEQLFRKGTVYSGEAHGGETTLNIKRDGLEFEWKKEF